MQDMRDLSKKLMESPKKENTFYSKKMPLPEKKGTKSKEDGVQETAEYKSVNMVCEEQ